MKNNKDENLISKKLITKNLDKNSYNLIKNYVYQILKEKNNYANILSNDLFTKYHIIQGLGKFGFSSKYQKIKLLDKNCSKTDLQNAREDVYIKFENQVKQLNIEFINTYRNNKYYELKNKNKLDKFPNIKPYINACKETNLQNLLNYLCKQFTYKCKTKEMKNLMDKYEKLDKLEKFDKIDFFYDIYNYYTKIDLSIYNYIFSKNTNVYKNWQTLINKFSYKRIIKVALMKFFKELYSLQIIFKKATIQHKNVINSFDKHFEKVNNIPYKNLIFNVNLPKSKSVIKLPFKTNYFYHHKMDNLNITYTSKTKIEKYKEYNYFVQTQFIYTIKLDEINKEVQIIYAIPKNKYNSKSNKKFKQSNNFSYQNTIGIDVNTKHNIFALSDGKTFQYDNYLINKCIKFDKERIKYQQKNSNKPYSKRIKKKQEKLNRISKAFLDKKVNELINYCISKNYNSIVMENLNFKKCKTSIKNEKGINYNRLASLIHLNDIKNVIKRIANHYDIMVSYIDPKYTSKQCMICGNIDKNNRLSQEIFRCICCGHTTNADVHAACNIKNRLVLFGNKLNIKFDKDMNGYKESKYHSLKQYLDVYNKFDKILISDEIWTTLNV